tara:strand:+ start:587 stop:1201 length:615 start_codon:yes stop_codon:yes gene_type:complete
MTEFITILMMILMMIYFVSSGLPHEIHALARELACHQMDMLELLRIDGLGALDDEDDEDDIDIDGLCEDGLDEEDESLPFGVDDAVDIDEFGGLLDDDDEEEEEGEEEEEEKRDDPLDTVDGADGAGFSSAGVSAERSHSMHSDMNYSMQSLDADVEWLDGMLDGERAPPSPPLTAEDGPAVVAQFSNSEDSSSVDDEGLVMEL